MAIIFNKKIKYAGLTPFIKTVEVNVSTSINAHSIFQVTCPNAAALEGYTMISSTYVTAVTMGAASILVGSPQKMLTGGWACRILNNTDNPYTVEGTMTFILIREDLVE